MHLRPKDPDNLLDVEEECQGWSRAVTNQHGVSEYACKCGRAKIVKLNLRGIGPMFVPVFDGETLTTEPYFRYGEAKSAVELAAQGQPLPPPKKASRPAHEYVDHGPEEGARRWQQTVEWFKRQHGQQTAEEKIAEAYATLGLPMTAEHATVKLTARRLKRKYHPDRNPGDEAAEEWFKKVDDAYKLLDERQAKSA